MTFRGGSNDIDSNGVPDECKDDCNGNGIPDYWEIAQGDITDCDGNGIPDACDLARGDLNLDGCIDGADLSFLLSLWGLPNPPIGDLDGDGVVDGFDLAVLLSGWAPCP